jgi:O-antigen/teichoic acid export membrane protein
MTHPRAMGETASPPRPRVGGRLRGAVTALSGVLGRASNQIIALGVTLLAARWLTPASFGDYAIAAALITFCRTLLYAGAFEFLLRAREGEEAHSECLAINLGLATGMSGLLALLSLFTGRLFHSPEIAGLLLTLAPSNLLAAGSAWQEAQLLRSGRIRTYYAVISFGEITAAAVAVALLLTGAGLLALVAQVYARALVLLLAYRAVRRPVWSASFSPARAARVARWSVARYGGTLVMFLSNYSADILLGAFLTPAATGLYRASHRMVTGVSDLINQPTRMMAITLFSRRAAEGRDPGDAWPRFAAACALLGWTALAGLAAVSAQVTPLVLGPRWRGAAPIIAILCLQRAFALIDGVSAPLLVAYGHARLLLTTQAMVAVASVALLTAMAPFGVAAAALSSVIAAAVSTMCLATLIGRFYGGVVGGIVRVAPVALGPMIAAVAGALLAGAGERPLHLAPIVALLGEAAGGGGAWALAALVLRGQVVRVLYALNPPGAAAEASTPLTA